MTTYIDGKEVKERLLEKLNATIEENNQLICEHNRKLVNYTRWLLILTIVIIVVATFQLITILIK